MARFTMGSICGLSMINFALLTVYIAGIPNQEPSTIRDMPSTGQVLSWFVAFFSGILGIFVLIGTLEDAIAAQAGAFAFVAANAGLLSAYFGMFGEPSVSVYFFAVTLSAFAGLVAGIAMADEPSARAKAD